MQVGKTVKSDIEETTQQEQTQEADRLQQDRLLEDEDHERIQTTTLKGNQQEIIDKTDSSEPNILSYTPTKELKGGSGLGSALTDTINLGQIDDVCQKLGSGPIEKPSRGEDVTSLFDINVSAQKIQQYTAKASSPPSLQPPSGEQAAASAPPSSTSNVSAYLSTGYITAIIGAFMDMESNNRYAMKESAHQMFELGMAAIDTLHDAMSQTIAAGKAEAHATKLKGWSDVASASASFATTALSAGGGALTTWLPKDEMGERGKAGPGLNAGLKFGEHAGSAVGAGVKMPFDLKMSKQQIIKATADAMAQQANAALKQLGETDQTLEKGISSVESANQATTQAREKLITSQKEATQRMFS
jgi:hypothetical protein